MGRCEKFAVFLIWTISAGAVLIFHYRNALERAISLSHFHSFIMHSAYVVFIFIFNRVTLHCHQKPGTKCRKNYGQTKKNKLSDFTVLRWQHDLYNKWGKSIMPLGRNPWQGHISQSLSAMCIRIMICIPYLWSTYLWFVLIWAPMAGVSRAMLCLCTAVSYH